MATSLYNKTIRQMQAATANVDRTYNSVTEGFMLAIDGVKFGRFYVSESTAKLQAMRHYPGAVPVAAHRSEAETK